MNGLNVFGLGHVVREPTVHKFDSGSRVCHLNLVFERKYNKKGPNGEKVKVEEPFFIEAKLWGDQAELIKEMAIIGEPFAIGGYLTEEKWEAKNGVAAGKKPMLIIQSFCAVSRRRKDDKATDTTAETEEIQEKAEIFNFPSEQPF